MPVRVPNEALADGAPQLHDEAPGNKIYSWGRGDADAAEKAIADAPHSVTLELINNRISCAALETRACLAVPDPAGGTTTLYDATQAPHLIRKSITDALGIPPGEVRVVAPDVGGGFGTKGKHYPEETILVWACRRLGRPVRWELIGSPHGHDAFLLETDQLGAILRGVRTVSDFESEYQMALTNRHLEPSVESVFVMPSAQYSYVSSSLIREVVRNGGDVSSFLPESVEQRLRDRLTTS